MRYVLIDYMHLAFRTIVAEPLSTTVTINGKVEVMDTTIPNYTIKNIFRYGGRGLFYTGVFFEGGTTYRKNYFKGDSRDGSGYKGDRSRQRGSFYEGINVALQFMKAGKMSLYRAQGYEADDLIYSMIQKIKETDTTTPIDIITNDSDLLPLVDNQVSVYIRGTRQYSELGCPEHRLYYQVTPRTWYEYLSYSSAYKGYNIPYNSMLLFKLIRGDKSDNVPGSVLGMGKVKYSEVMDDMVNSGYLYVGKEVQNKISEGFYKAYIDATVKNIEKVFNLYGSISEKLYLTENDKKALHIIQEHIYKLNDESYSGNEETFITELKTELASEVSIENRSTSLGRIIPRLITMPLKDIKGVNLDDWFMKVERSEITFLINQLREIFLISNIRQRKCLELLDSITSKELILFTNLTKDSISSFLSFDKLKDIEDNMTEFYNFTPLNTPEIKKVITETDISLLFGSNEEIIVGKDEVTNSIYTALDTYYTSKRKTKKVKEALSESLTEAIQSFNRLYTDEHIEEVYNILGVFLGKIKDTSRVYASKCHKEEKLRAFLRPYMSDIINIEEIELTLGVDFEGLFRYGNDFDTTMKPILEQWFTEEEVEKMKFIYGGIGLQKALMSSVPQQISGGYLQEALLPLKINIIG